MVYTLTLNPSLDHILHLDQLDLGETNRSTREEFYAGGKGINVSRVLKSLGVDTKALGFFAGFSGQELKRILTEQEIPQDFLELAEGFNRINVKLKAQTETEINSNGPKIRQGDLVSLFQKFEELTKEDWLVLAGTIPQGLPKDLYAKIMEKLAPIGVPVIVDATGETLLATLPFKPYLIKPNLRELEELVGRPLENQRDQIQAMRQLKEQGAQQVLVSLGGDGALYLGETDQVYVMEPPKGQVKNTVGAGDSMVAGFVAATLARSSEEDILRWAITCGSATAFNEDLAGLKEVETLSQEMNAMNHQPKKIDEGESK